MLALSVIEGGLGRHAPSCETVCLWVNVIKTGWEKTDDDPHSEALTMAMDKRYIKEGKSVLECTRSISGTKKATEVRTLRQVFTVSLPTAWRHEKFVQSEFPHAQ